MTGEAASLLEEAMEPLLPFLQDPATEDVAMQVPGIAWVYSRGNWARKEVPIDSEQMWEIAKLAGSAIHRDVDESKPLLDTTLPDDRRFGAATGVLSAPPRFFAAVHGAVEVGKTVFTIRKPDIGMPRWEDASDRYNTKGWNEWQRFRAGRDLSALLKIFKEGDLWTFLPAAVRAKLTVLFVGDTGAGKTTMAKMAGSAIGHDERIVTIEDAIELVLRQLNNVRFLYPSDGKGPVTVHTLLEGALRSRPGRILIQEIRQAEVASVYLHQSGHRGSLATIHGNDAAGGVQHLFQLYKSSADGRGLDDKTAADMITNMVDVVIPLSRDGAGEVVAVGPTWFVADAELRNETALDLLR